MKEESWDSTWSSIEKSLLRCFRSSSFRSLRRTNLISPTLRELMKKRLTNIWATTSWTLLNRNVNWSNNKFCPFRCLIWRKNFDEILTSWALPHEWASQEHSHRMRTWTTSIMCPLREICPPINSQNKWSCSSWMHILRTRLLNLNSTKNETCTSSPTPLCATPWRLITKRVKCLLLHRWQSLSTTTIAELWGKRHLHERNHNFSPEILECRIDPWRFFPTGVYLVPREDDQSVHLTQRGLDPWRMYGVSL